MHVCAYVYVRVWGAGALWMWVWGGMWDVGVRRVMYMGGDGVGWRDDEDGVADQHGKCGS